MPLAISRTVPFRRLLSRIGRSTYRLNTILVGLECIASGMGESGAVAVTWKKPTSDKAGQVADQARIFACTSALVLAADVFDSFLRELAGEEWLGFGVSTREIATKARTRSKSEGGEYSVAERSEAFCEDLGLEDPVRVAALDLMTKWRNVVAHSSERPMRLTSKARGTLLEAAEHIHNQYSHLNIALAIENFENRRAPVPKEVTTLIAVAVNFSRSIDEASIKRVASSGERMCVAADIMLRIYFRPSSERRVTPWHELADAWQGGVTRRTNMLKKFLASSGITETRSPVSACLPAGYIEDLVSLSRDDVARRFGIEHD